MPVPAFVKFNFNDTNLNSVQEAVRRSLDPLVQLPMIQGLTLNNVPLNGSGVSNLIAHKLGRTIQGYFVTWVSGGAIAYPYVDTSTSYDASKFIDLRTSTAGSFTINLWVF